MEKPTLANFTISDDGEEAFDYFKITDYLEKEFGLDVQDMAGARKWFDTWCDSRGYGKVDPTGNPRSHSTIWFAEYQAAPDGKATEPPSLDFTKWLFDRYDMAPDTVTYIWVADHLADELEDHVRLVLETLQLNFGDELPLYMPEL